MVGAFFFFFFSAFPLLARFCSCFFLDIVFTHTCFIAVVLLFFYEHAFLSTRTSRGLCMAHGRERAVLLRSLFLLDTYSRTRIVMFHAWVFSLKQELFLRGWWANVGCFRGQLFVLAVTGNYCRLWLRAISFFGLNEDERERERDFCLASTRWNQTMRGEKKRERNVLLLLPYKICWCFFLEIVFFFCFLFSYGTKIKGPLFVGFCRQVLP